MRVMFMGTPEIAAVCLEELAKVHEVVCVVTQPDKPKDRGHKIAFPAVKQKALELNIDILQPSSLKSNALLDDLYKYNPEVIVVVAYGKILPSYILEFPKYNCINVHASLLPKYRGAAPIQWAIVKGEKVSGVTIMLMNEGLDTGDMLLKREIPITETMTAGQLHDELCKVCPPVLLETLDKIDEIVPQKQDDANSTYAPPINKEMCKVDWNQSSKDIVNLIRGMNPFPTARTAYKGKNIKLFGAIKSDKSGKSGEIIDLSNGITVACGDGAVIITELQMEGKKRMSAEAFLCGCKMQVGEFME